MDELNARPRFCPMCGTSVRAGSSFCPGCGRRLGSEFSEAAGTVAGAAVEATENVTETAAESMETVAETMGTAAETVAETAVDNVAEATETLAEDVDKDVADLVEELKGVLEDPEETAQEFTNEFENAQTSEPGTSGRINPYTGRAYTSEFDRMMAEFEASKRANDQARRTQYRNGTATEQTTVQQTSKKKEGRKGVPFWACLLMTLAGVVLAVILTITVLSSMSPDRLRNTAFGTLAQKIASETSTRKNNDGSKTGEDVKVGDETVPSGSQVTINISGDSASKAAAVYAKCDQSVVGIGIYAKTSSNPWSTATMQVTAEGSGVIYTSDGYIITNQHVIADAIDSNSKLKSGCEIRVYTDKSLASYYVATVIGADETADLAVLKIDETGLVPIEFAEANSVAIGDEVFALGCPGGLEFMGTISRGIVGGVGKNILTEKGYALDLILTDAAINPGVSGGALLNAEGKLIGICEMKIVEENFESMGFAISVATVKKVTDALIKDGKVTRPGLGISVNTNYGPQAANEAGLPSGAWVAEVTKGSAADKAGITSNMIITEMNGVRVYDYPTLRAEILKCVVGDTITIKAYVYDENNKQNGTYKTFTVQLQELVETDTP